MQDKPWTRKELSLRIGFAELAKAVIEQWHKDGEPECDREAMNYWFKVKQECEEHEKPKSKEIM